MAYAMTEQTARNILVDRANTVKSMARHKTLSKRYYFYSACGDGAGDDEYSEDAYDFLF